MSFYCHSLIKRTRALWKMANSKALGGNMQDEVASLCSARKEGNSHLYPPSPQYTNEICAKEFKKELAEMLK